MIYSMKLILNFLPFFTITFAGPIHPDVQGEGVSSQYRNQDNSGHYNFGYNEDHATGGTFRRETRNAYGSVIGSYGLKVDDARIRIVKYVADKDGFRVSIDTNEPGVEPQDPSATAINKPGLLISPVRPINSYISTPSLHPSLPLYAASYHEKYYSYY